MKTAIRVGWATSLSIITWFWEVGGVVDTFTDQLIYQGDRWVASWPISRWLAGRWEAIDAWDHKTSARYRTWLELPTLEALGRGIEWCLPLVPYLAGAAAVVLGNSILATYPYPTVGAVVTPPDLPPTAAELHRHWLLGLPVSLIGYPPMVLRPDPSWSEQASLRQMGGGVAWLLRWGGLVMIAGAFWHRWQLRRVRLWEAELDRRQTETEV